MAAAARRSGVLLATAAQRLASRAGAPPALVLWLRAHENHHTDYCHTFPDANGGHTRWLCFARATTPSCVTLFTAPTVATNDAASSSTTSTTSSSDATESLTELATALTAATHGALALSPAALASFTVLDAETNVRHALLAFADPLTRFDALETAQRANAEQHGLQPSDPGLVGVPWSRLRVLLPESRRAGKAGSKKPPRIGKGMYKGVRSSADRAEAHLDCRYLEAAGQPALDDSLAMVMLRHAYRHGVVFEEDMPVCLNHAGLPVLELALSITPAGTRCYAPTTRSRWIGHDVLSKTLFSTDRSGE